MAGDVIGAFNGSYMDIERAHLVVDVFKAIDIPPGPESRVSVNHTKPDLTFLSLAHHPVCLPEMVYPRR